MKKVVHAACPHDCPDACGVLITVEDGRATRIQGDPGASRDPRIFVRQGREISGSCVFAPGAFSIPCGVSFPRVEAPQQTPATSSGFPGTRPSPKLQPGSRHVAAEFGAEAILPYSYGGTLGTLNGASMDRRFFHRLGASQLERTICSDGGRSRAQVRDRSETGHRAGTISPLALHHRLGRQYSRKQRAPVAVHRGSATRRRKISSD